MLITFEDRSSDSPVVERVWRSHSERAGTFRSMATCNWGLVVTRLEGRLSLTIRGPETTGTAADCPADGEWVGAQFTIGTYMPPLPTGLLRDRHDVTLPAASARSFLLEGSAWESPTYDSMETFVERLVRAGLIVADPYAQAALRGETRPGSARTMQRRVLRATGMTPATIRQIQRARRATMMLRAGAAIADVAYDAGYYDQAHLTRSLRRFIGHTPAAIAAGRDQLSLLYKTDAD